MKRILITLFLLLSLPLMAANEIWFVSTAGQTNLKATITRPSDGYVWDTSLGTPAFAASASVDWVNRDITVTEDAANPGVYYGDFPAITTAGIYLVRIYADAATLEITDAVIENFTVDWAGTVESWNHNTTVDAFSTSTSDTLTLKNIVINNSDGIGFQITGSSTGMQITGTLANGLYLDGNTNALYCFGNAKAIYALGKTTGSLGIVANSVSASDPDITGTLSSNALDLTDIASMADDWLDGGRLDLILDRSGGGTSPLR